MATVIVWPARRKTGCNGCGLIRLQHYSLNRSGNSWQLSDHSHTGCLWSWVYPSWHLVGSALRGPPSVAAHLSSQPLSKGSGKFKIKKLNINLNFYIFFFCFKEIPLQEESQRVTSRHFDRHTLCVMYVLHWGLLLRLYPDRQGISCSLEIWTQESSLVIGCAVGYSAANTSLWCSTTHSFLYSTLVT